jgi:hypothetical protein
MRKDHETAGSTRQASGHGRTAPATSEIDLIFKKYRGMKALKLAMEAAKAAQAGEAPREPAGAKVGGLTGVAGLAEAVRKEKAMRMAKEAENKDRSRET